MRWAIWVLTAMALAATPVAAAECAPTKMARIVTYNGAGDVDPTAPSARLRTMHRLTERYARIEETPPPGAKHNLVVIVAEPDIWMVDQIGKKGQRTKDPGPVYEFRAPIIAMPTAPALFRKLEVGCELDFIAAYAPRSAGEVKVGGKAYDRRQVIMGPLRLEFLLHLNSGKPFQVALYRNDKAEMIMRYAAYETGLQPDMRLFAPPPGVSITTVRGPEAAKPAAKR